MYNDLFALRENLKNNPETLEFLVANGDLTAGQNTKHPMVTKKVRIEFDDATHSLQIVDNDSEPEIYSELFIAGIDDIDPSVINEFKSILAETLVHPLDTQGINDFLERFASRISKDTRYIKDENTQPSYNDRIVIRYNPVFIMRKKLDGTLQFIGKLLEKLSETQDITSPLPPILGFPESDEPTPYVPPTFEQELASLNGESLDVLLPKVANREQLQIAERIQKESAVVVQGPPGTGKTHTIANILGHFLSEGKSVLIASQKSKALAVLRDKLPEKIKGLCVPLFDDELGGVENSVNEITEQISATNSQELNDKIKGAEKKRVEIMQLLEEKRKKIFNVKFKEFEPLIYLGDRYSPMDMAKEVTQHSEILDIIPGSVDKDAAFPVSIEDLQKYYSSNSKISAIESEELVFNIPSPTKFAFEKAEDFEADLIAIQTAKSDWKEQEQKYPDYTFDYKKLRIRKNEKTIAKMVGREKLTHLVELLKDFECLEQWGVEAACDGKQGSGFKERWVLLKTQIESAVELSSSVASSFLGKKFEYDADNEKLKSFLDKLQRTYYTKGKIPWYTFAFDRVGKELFASTKLNGRRLSSATDCQALKDFIALDKKRKAVAWLWNRLIAKFNVPVFEELGDAPELTASNYCPKIERYINWYKKEYLPLEDSILECGIVADEFFDFPDSMPDKERIRKTFEILSNEITNVAMASLGFCDACDALKKGIKLIEEFDTRKTKTIEILSEGKRTCSELCKKLITAIEDENVDEWNKNYEKIQSLQHKYELQSFRNEILRSIRKVAPFWADALEKRNGIHGKDDCPENILEVGNTNNLQQYSMI